MVRSEGGIWPRLGSGRARDEAEALLEGFHDALLPAWGGGRRRGRPTERERRGRSCREWRGLSQGGRRTLRRRIGAVCRCLRARPDPHLEEGRGAKRSRTVAPTRDVIMSGAHSASCAPPCCRCAPAPEPRAPEANSPRLHWRRAWEAVTSGPAQLPQVAARSCAEPVERDRSRCVCSGSKRKKLGAYSEVARAQWDAGASAPHWRAPILLLLV